MKARTIAIRSLATLALVCLTVCARGQIGKPASEKSTSAYPKGSYWDSISTEHPTCAGLVAKHYAMTQQLEGIFDRAQSTPAPKQSAVVDEMNKLAKERNEIARQIGECVKQSLRARGIEQRDKQSGGANNERPVLEGGVKEDVVQPEVPEKPGPPLRPGVPVPDVPIPIPIPGGGGGGNGPTIPGGVDTGGGPPAQPTPSPTPSPGQPSPSPNPNRPRPQPPRKEPPRDNAKRNSRPVFNYYYINGINTPMDGQGRGNASWDRRLIAGNLLSIGPRLGKKQNGSGYQTRVRVGNEIDVLGPMTHNASGKDPLKLYHPVVDAWIDGFCDWQSAATRGIAKDLADQLCAAAKWIRSQKGDWLQGQAAGDLLECARQALEVFPGPTGIGFSADTEVVRQVSDLILDTYRREKESGSTNYFIVIGHSQGNFFTEGVAYRLGHLSGPDQPLGQEIFQHRLGLVSLASPTSYDSLPEWFRQRRIAHFTREDDAIVALRQFGETAKKPWPKDDDLLPVWKWAEGNLEKALRIGSPGFQSPYLSAMSHEPPPECHCPEPDAALYVPLLNSHLLENYLADPPLAEPGRAMNEAAAKIIGLNKAVTPPTNPVLGQIRFGLFQLKQELMFNSASITP